MRRFITPFFLVLGLFFMTGNSMAISGQTKPPLQYELSQVTISIRHQTSRGIPGGYELTIRGDGNGSYLQEKAGKPIKTDLQLSTEQLLEIINGFYHIHFFDLADRYSVRKQVVLKNKTTLATLATKMVDMDGTKLCIQLADYKKCVTIIDNQPSEADQLVKTIEDLFDK